MALYSSLSFGRGDFGTAFRGKSASFGNPLNRAADTSGRRWYDSISAVQSLWIERFMSQLPPGCLSTKSCRSYATSRYTVHLTSFHFGSVHGSDIEGIATSGLGAITGSYSTPFTGVATALTVVVETLRSEVRDRFMSEAGRIGCETANGRNSTGGFDGGSGDDDNRNASNKIVIVF